jgi:hypothetical protein
MLRALEVAGAVALFDLLEDGAGAVDGAADV